MLNIILLWSKLITNQRMKQCGIASLHKFHVPFCVSRMQYQFLQGKATQANDTYKVSYILNKWC